jgi:DNA-binding CsgD family transcriptional regulator
MAGLDRIESAVRADQTQAARLWVDDFAGFAAATGQAWAAAIAEHGKALLADPRSTEGHFQTALELHNQGGQVRRPFNRARTQLAYGEYLRRARRRVDARTHLRAALETFEDLRARPWADRAAQELRASGETARKRDETAPVDLTPTELQVAQLVQRGMSNREVAGQLFVSPRTVDFHLRNVFTKAGVTSRLELAQLTLT